MEDENESLKKRVKMLEGSPVRVTGQETFVLFMA